MLEGRGLCCIKGGRILFRQLQVRIRPGQLLRITGANGSGKSCLLRMLCGLDRPPAEEYGTLFWRGRPLTEVRSSYHAQLRYVGHAAGISLALSPRRNLQWLRALHGDTPPKNHPRTAHTAPADAAAPTAIPDPAIALAPAMRNVPNAAALNPSAPAAPDPAAPNPATPTTLDLAAADPLAYFRLQEFADRPCRLLSAGQRRRVALARLCLGGAALWLLDEPFAALDEAGRELLRALLDQHLERGGAVVLSCHGTHVYGAQADSIQLGD